MLTNNNQEKIFITRPQLPSLEKLQPYLEEIWDNKILTNNGPFHKRFEKELANYLEVEQVNLFTNGTIALLVGLQALCIKGEVITTPFSFVATTHVLKWNGITPVFCDIENKSLNIDPNKIEMLISPKTTAIMPVHIYGYPCDTDKIQAIADKYSIKVIYDAAHAFGTKLNNKNFLLEGDMSVLSFHGTKLFNTFEGGAIVSSNEEFKKRIDYLKNFGIADEETVTEPGINGKMNEFQSIIGLLSLETVEEEIANRKKIAEIYFELLADIKGIKVFNQFDGYEYNYAFFPILIDEKEFSASRDRVYDELKKNNIFTKKYFYPLISNMPSYRSLPSAAKKNLPVANKISEQILCLPIYGTLKSDSVNKIVEIIKTSGRNV